MFRQVKGIFSGTNGRQAPLMRNKRRPQIDETALILRCNISNQPSWQGPWAHPPEVSARRLKCSPSACQSPAVKESPAVKQSPAVKESPVLVDLEGVLVDLEGGLGDRDVGLLDAVVWILMLVIGD
ncbi:MAG: hypothetical protein EBS52_11445 [Betaproteobacteria bacterium]|nr:hypothetical protein [Betaproteobacteria bacterium]